jgi:hypothetical protein
LCATNRTAPGALPLAIASFNSSSRGANQLCSSFEATGAGVVGAGAGSAAGLVDCGLDEGFCANAIVLTARRETKTRTSTAAGRSRRKLK